jgi:ASC-1-like (ASCH) protein
MTSHIAIMSHRSLLDKIFAGEKTIESRFSRVKSPPFGQITAGDKVYFKLSGGPVVGYARVAQVEEFENLTPQQIENLTTKYRGELALSEDFLARKMESKFASLLFLEDVAACEPWNYKQEGRSGWIILATDGSGEGEHSFATTNLAAINKQENLNGGPHRITRVGMADF